MFSDASAENDIIFYQGVEFKQLTTLRHIVLKTHFLTWYSKGFPHRFSVVNRHVGVKSALSLKWHWNWSQDFFEKSDSENYNSTVISTDILFQSNYFLRLKKYLKTNIRNKDSFSNVDHPCSCERSDKK